MIPEGAGAADWKSSGNDLKNDGEREVGRAKDRQTAEALVDSAAVMIKS